MVKLRLRAMHLNSLNLTTLPSGWWADTGSRLALIASITAAFALLGWLVRGVSRSGAVAGAVVCFALLASVGPGAFAGLLAVFAVTWLATRFGRARKLRLGVAERKEGRTASQVLANTGMAAACAVCYSAWHAPLMLLGMAAALAVAAADTVSSECGQALKREARLITTFQTVPAGTDGGITLAGTAAGAVAALLVSMVEWRVGLLSPRWMWIVALAGVAGMVIDSVLGALFERRGWIGNDSVNFISTVVAAVAAAGVAGM
jgi:uncharacterized protein (TIGR00297 family)